MASMTSSTVMILVTLAGSSCWCSLSAYSTWPVVFSINRHAPASTARDSALAGTARAAVSARAIRPEMIFFISEFPSFFDVFLFFRRLIIRICGREKSNN